MCNKLKMKPGFLRRDELKPQTWKPQEIDKIL